MGLFTKDTKYKEPPQYGDMRSLIASIAGNAPQINANEIAGMSGLEQLGLNLAEQYAGQPSEELLTALKSLGNMGQAQNVMDIPEYAALYKSMSGDMNKELNRIGRSLQLGGNTSSSSGANVLGSALGSLQSRLMGTMAPYAQDLFNKRYNAPMQAAQLRDTDTQNRINTSMSVGQLPRSLEQLGNDARYQAQMFNATAPFQYQVPAASQIFGSGGQTVSGGGMSDLGIAAMIGGSLAGGQLAGGGTLFGFGGAAV